MKKKRDVTMCVPLEPFPMMMTLCARMTSAFARTIWTMKENALLAMKPMVDALPAMTMASVPSVKLAII